MYRGYAMVVSARFLSIRKLPCPSSFVRVAFSSIPNIMDIFRINRNLLRGIHVMKIAIASRKYVFRNDSKSITTVRFQNNFIYYGIIVVLLSICVDRGSSTSHFPPCLKYVYVPTYRPRLVGGTRSSLTRTVHQIVSLNTIIIFSLLSPIL